MVVRIVQAFYLSVIMLYEGNIWVAKIPYPSVTFAGLGVLLIAAKGDWLSGTKMARITLALCTFALVAVTLTQLASIEFSVVAGKELSSIVAYLLLTGCSIVIVTRLKPDQEAHALRVYVIVCSLMSLLGFIAWLNVNFTWVMDQQIDPRHLIDIDQFTGGRINRISHNVERTNQFGIYENTYSFPYLMGLVLTNSYLYEFLRIPFFRASGWYPEPTAIDFAVIPPLILTWTTSLFGKRTRLLLFATQLCFLFASFSVSIILALLVVFALRKVLKGFIDRRFKITARSITWLVIITLVMLVIGVYGFKQASDPTIARGILASKTATTDYQEIALGVVTDPIFGFCFAYFSVIAIAFLWRGLRKGNEIVAAFSMIVLCLQIMSLKGNFYHNLISPAFFTLYFLITKHFNNDLLPRRRVSGQLTSS